jgi:hypothetical protein
MELNASACTQINTHVADGDALLALYRGLGEARVFRARARVTFLQRAPLIAQRWVSHAWPGSSRFQTDLSRPLRRCRGFVSSS